MKILITDDDNSFRSSVAKLLRLNGYEVAEARDGKEFFEKFFYGKPDKLIMDIGLPGELSGLVCIEKIREKNKEIPIVVITHYEDKILVPFELNRLFLL